MVARQNYPFLRSMVFKKFKLIIKLYLNLTSLSGITKSGWFYCAAFPPPCTLGNPSKLFKLTLKNRPDFQTYRFPLTVLSICFLQVWITPPRAKQKAQGLDSFFFIKIALYYCSKNECDHSKKLFASYYSDYLSIIFLILSDHRPLDFNLYLQKSKVLIQSLFYFISPCLSRINVILKTRFPLGIKLTGWNSYQHMGLLHFTEILKPLL